MHALRLSNVKEAHLLRCVRRLDNVHQLRVEHEHGDECDEVEGKVHRLNAVEAAIEEVVVDDGDEGDDGLAEEGEHEDHHEAEAKGQRGEGEGKRE